MATFIVPVNPYMSDIEKISEIFETCKCLLWMHKEEYPEYQKGDVVYMYICNPCKKIRFKVYIEDVKVQATAEELRDYTWLKPEDREKQIQNNCNDKFVLVKEIEAEKRGSLTLNKLSKNGFENPLDNPFPGGLPVNITDMKGLIGYIESVING